MEKEEKKDTSGLILNHRNKKLLNRDARDKGDKILKS